MFLRPLTSRLAAAFAGSFACLAPFALGLSTADAIDSTKVTDLVVYGVPQGSQELFRYDFGSDTYSTIGVLTDQYGRTVVDLKGLTYIPLGPDKGLYGASEESPFMDHLVKIDGLTADAMLYSQDMGTGKISGMVAYETGGKWYLLTADYNDELYSIDPTTGAGTFLCPLKNRYQGLALDSNGLVFATTGDGEIWAINVPARMAGDANAEWQVGSHGYGGIEALEFAFGIDEPRISPADLAGVGEPWVENGMMFSYGQGSGLLIVNPANGMARSYDCSLPSLDLEGIVFMAENADGWGQITVSACD